MSAVVREIRPTSRRSDDVEVATLTADALRASMRVTGPVGRCGVSLLTSVLNTHTTTGRRHLRVDLGAATVDPSAYDALLRMHASIRALGGMLVLENAGPALVDAIRGAQLFATSR